MEYTTDDIIKDVKVALDRNIDSEALISIEDLSTLTLNEIINNSIEDAAQSVLLQAPSTRIGEGKSFSGDVAWESRHGFGMGFLKLPDDFLRLITFQMSDWERAVTIPIFEDSPLYQRQRSRYPGVRGCPQRPIVAIVQYPTGQYIEFFNCVGGEEVSIKRAQYLAYPKIQESKIELPEKCYSAIIYLIAARVCQIIKETDQSNILMAISKEMLI